MISVFPTISFLCYLFHALQAQLRAEEERKVAEEEEKKKAEMDKRKERKRMEKQVS